MSQGQTLGKDIQLHCQVDRNKRGLSQTAHRPVTDGELHLNISMKPVFFLKKKNNSKTFFRKTFIINRVKTSHCLLKQEYNVEGRRDWERASAGCEGKGHRGGALGEMNHLLQN